RWRPDGTILFEGRGDDQVKVRGFRIELGEIEAQLAHHHGVRAVHVSAPVREGVRRLVAYIIPKQGETPSPSALREFLAPRLPEHMLPQAFVSLPALPLTMNGKVDRRALPAPDAHHFDAADTRVLPRTEDEAALAAVWGDLLDSRSPSVTDNFFGVGGDSILAIRLAARASDAGIALTPTDVFRLQTIEKLAVAASARRARERPGTVSAFKDELLGPTDWTARCAFASLTLPAPVSVVDLGLAIQVLVERHEALRLRRLDGDSAGQIEILAFVPPLPVRTVTAAVADDDLDGFVATHEERLSRGIDLEAGVNVAVTLLERPGLHPVLILAVNQSVADEWSVASITTELGAMVVGTGPAAAERSSATLGAWLSWLGDAVDGAAAGEGLRTLEQLPPGARPQAAWQTSPAPLHRSLDAHQSACLLDSGPRALGVHPLDLLACALAGALSAEEDDSLLIEALEARPAIEGAPDTRDLVGPFDGVMPLSVPTKTMALAERVRAAKAARQRVSSTGPVLRALQTVFTLPSPQFGLAWTMDVRADTALHIHASPAFSPSVETILIARPVDGRVRLTLWGKVPDGDGGRLLDGIAACVSDLAKLAREATHPLHTPQDFPSAGLPDNELSAVLQESDGVEDVLALSPMQEAMLVHTLAAEASEVNFEQSAMRIRGQFDQEAFGAAWTAVFARHSALRTSFRWRGLSRPVQVVHRAVDTPLTSRPVEGALTEEALEAFMAADRAKGFDLEAAPLVRLTLLESAADDVTVVASFHHLLVDGWCLSLLEREVRAAYEAAHRGRNALFEPPVPYARYIAWLMARDNGASRRHFADKLKGVSVRRIAPPASAAPSGFITDRAEVPRETTRALTAFARRRGLTLGTLIHFAWGVWLTGRLGTDDVVFGTTVSGRPAEIPGVEGIVGLFINNLPVRFTVSANTDVGDALARMQETLGALQQHAHISPVDIVAAAGLPGHLGALFDTLVVVENLAAGTSAWRGAEGLTVDALANRLKTAYDATLVAIPGETLRLSLVQPDHGASGTPKLDPLQDLVRIMTALAHADVDRVADLPLPDRGPSVLAGQAEGAGFVLARRTRSTMEALIAECLSEVPAFGPHIQAPQPDLDTDFWAMGLTSLGLIQLAHRLGERLERPVPISLLLEHRTVENLARALEDGARWHPIVRLTDSRTGESEGEGGEPFVCVHPVAGDVSVFLDLAEAFPPAIPFWAVQAAGLEPGQTPIETVEALASHNIEALADVGLSRPKAVGGYSFGGLVAFDMARQLAAAGTAPEAVVIIDTPAPLERHSILNSDPNAAQAQWLMRMIDVRARFHGVDVALDEDTLLDLPEEKRFARALAALHESRLIPPGVDEGWLRRAHHTSLVQYNAYLRYTPDHLPCDLTIHLIRAANPRHGDLGDSEVRQLGVPHLGWQSLTEVPVHVVEVPGDHVSILAPDHVPAVAAAIAGILRP
ncbi:MAG: condensation domain-containing protein, partial [Pseudomonadota bacterium]